MNRRYKRDRVWAPSPIVSIAELDTPIVIIAALKEPLAGTGNWTERVNPYLQTLAGVDRGARVREGSEQADASSQSTFVIRDEGHAVSVFDYIVEGQEVFKILSCRTIGRRINQFLEIATMPYGNANTCNFVLDTNLPTTTAGETLDEKAANPYWPI